MRIYAKQVPPDIQESHFDIGMYPDVTITGNSRFKEYRSELYEKVNEHVTDASEEFVECGYDEPDDSCLDELLLRHLNVKPRSEDERAKWRFLLSDWTSSLGEFADAMSLVAGKPYHAHGICGCCQSDWNGVICPDEMTAGSPSSLQALESEYFNTGSEWMVYESEDACEAECDGTSIYVLDMQNPREVIADCYGVMPADVEAYAFDRYEKIPKYKRMEDAV